MRTLIYRYRLLRLMLHALAQDHAWLKGYGPGSLDPQIRRWIAQHGVMTQGHYNEVLCMWWDYGVLGVLSCILLMIQVGIHLRFHDPFSAAAMVGAVIAMGSFPARVPAIGVVWLVVLASVGR